MERSCADEDMTSMHMVKYGEWYEDEGDLQGFSKSSRRPKAYSVRILKVEAQNNSSSSPHGSLGVARTKNGAQVAYGVHFRRSLYGWKDNFKELTMALVQAQIH